jgi:hypothetical protein
VFVRVESPTDEQFFLQTRRISFNPMLRVTLEVSLHHADDHNVPIALLRPVRRSHMLRALFPKSYRLFRVHPLNLISNCYHC